MSQMNIATWNLCLGLPNKKDLVCDYLVKNKINACCLQETEIPMNFPEDVLNCNDYVIELEQNTVKKRVGIYIHKDTKYVRRKDLIDTNVTVNRKGMSPGRMWQLTVLLVFSS